jgi:nucleotide-binding universal stress UspA family protein
MYRKILLPLDGSELAHRAMRHAVELARLADAELVLLQVVESEAQVIAQTTPATIEPIPGTGAVSAEVVHEAIAEQRRAATANLEASAQTIRGAGVKRVSFELAEGAAGEAIVDAAVRLGCDLVVMATHGRSGIKRAILGSVADHVARHTPGIPVLLVHPEVEA